MENIGDWIYVVILIIAGISSIFNALKKKNKEAAEQPQHHEVFTESENNDDYPFQTPYYSEIKPKKPTEKVYEKLHSMTQTETENIQLEIENSPTITLEDLPSDTDDWRKAFVYKEIFERKY